MYLFSLLVILAYIGLSLLFVYFTYNAFSTIPQEYNTIEKIKYINKNLLPSYIIIFLLVMGHLLFHFENTPERTRQNLKKNYSYMIEDYHRRNLQREKDELNDVPFEIDMQQMKERQIEQNKKYVMEITTESDK